LEDENPGGSTISGISQDAEFEKEIELGPQTSGATPKSTISSKLATFTDVLIKFSLSLLPKD